VAEQSKGFGKPVHVDKTASKSNQRLQQFAKKFEEHPLSDRFEKTVINPAGVTRMSDVLEDFTEPYLKAVQNHEEREKMFTLAVVAWNAALLPRSEGHTMVDQFLKMLPEQGLVDDGIREMIDEMIQRKLEQFADIRRVIVNMELIDQGKTFHLSVASAPMPNGK
jgi:hypothetical protein